jgi:hypothetical protein
MANYQLTVGMMAGNIQEQLDNLEKSIASVKHFHLGKVNNHAKVEGIREYPAGKVPFEHQDHFYDSKGRVVKLQIYNREFSKPSTRYYFYEGEDQNIAESIWFDRWGELDNMHRYSIDPFSKMMIERSEYDVEGNLFYTIKSLYDSSKPPLLTEEAWHSPSGAPIKRRCYRYDKEGRLEFEQHYNEKNRFEGFYLLAYDTRSNIRKKAWHNGTRSLMSTFEYAYDSKDRVVKVTLRNNTNLIKGTQEFLYDEIGAIVEEKFFDDEHKLIKHLHF